MKRVVSAIGVALVFFALSDILMWQRIFERNQLFVYGSDYQAGWMTTLLGAIAIGVVLLWDDYELAVTYALSVYTLAFSGLEDALYYILDGRAIPAVLPWLNENRLILFKPVTLNGLLVSIGFWVIFWMVIITVLDKERSEANTKSH